VNQNCDDGAPGWRFTVNFPLNLTTGGVIPNVTLGGPVRFAQVMRLKYYSSGGKSWLGMKSVTPDAATEPVVGPLSDNANNQRGLSFEYFDKANAQTATLNNIRSVRITLRGITDERVRGSADASGSIDTLTLATTVALRNALRP
jgi:hypothetical protein